MSTSPTYLGPAIETLVREHNNAIKVREAIVEHGGTYDHVDARIASYRHAIEVLKREQDSQKGKQP